MGTIVLHAGMEKAGSTTIQGWLGRQVRGLREVGIRVLLARVTGPDPSRAVVQLTDHPADGVSGKSTELWKAYQQPQVSGYEQLAARPHTLGSWAVDSLLEQLDARATRERVIVLSAEGLQHSFWGVDETFLAGLEELGRRHRVRVAYYVRPQHTALEARWRQWGYRTFLSPAQYIAAASNSLHYLETWASVAEVAPSVSFEPRPFRQDLLDAGNPAADFGRRFLELVDLPPDATSTWENRGLPLELVNALSFAPRECSWLSPITGSSAEKLIKRLWTGLVVEETDESETSRRLLQAHCHEVFESGNLRLADRLKWDTDAFIPAVHGLDGEETGLDALDLLWKPSASGAELAAFYSTLEYALSHEREAARREAMQAKGKDHERSVARADQRLKRAEKRAARAERRSDRVEAELAAVRSSPLYRLSDAVDRVRRRAVARTIREASAKVVRRGS